MQEATVQSQEFPLLSRTFPVHILHSCVFFSAAQSFRFQAHPFLVKLAMAIFILFSASRNSVVNAGLYRSLLR